MATGQPRNFSLNILSRQRRGTRYGRKARVGTPQHIDAETRAQLLGMVPEQSAPEMSEAELTGELSAPATPENLPETDPQGFGAQAPPNSDMAPSDWGQATPGKSYAQLASERSLTRGVGESAVDLGMGRVKSAVMTGAGASYYGAPARQAYQIGAKGLGGPFTAVSTINKMAGKGYAAEKALPGMADSLAGMTNEEIDAAVATGEGGLTASKENVDLEENIDPTAFNPAEHAVQMGRQSVQTSPGLLGHGVRAAYNKVKGLFSPTDAPAPQVTQEVAAPPTEVSTVTSPAVPAGIKELPLETRKALMGAPQETGGGGEGQPGVGDYQTRDPVTGEVTSHKGDTGFEFGPSVSPEQRSKVETALSGAPAGQGGEGGESLDGGSAPGVGGFDIDAYGDTSYGGDDDGDGK